MSLLEMHFEMYLCKIINLHHFITICVACPYHWDLYVNRNFDSYRTILTTHLHSVRFQAQTIGGPCLNIKYTKWVVENFFLS